MAIDPPAKLTLSQDSLTYREMDIMEEACGGFGSALDDDGELDMSKLPVMKSMRAMVLIAARRENPEVTMEDVLDWPPEATELVMLDDDGDEPSPPDSGGS